MVPPIEGASPKQYIDSTAPLSKWEIVEFYKSKSKCEHWRGIWNREDTWQNITDNSNSHPLKREAFEKSLCRSTDDPTVKGNPDIRHFKTGYWQPD
jgi:hypothetical protein